MPDLRTFVLSRSGFAGIQRYAANWLGDNQSRWDHLLLSIAMGSGFGISGQAFIGADIGGFQGNSKAELFLRWMQYGVLTPFCRNHSEIGNVDQYAWAWGEVVQDHVRNAISLRYRLLPYLYACFLTASETGAPVQRPLVFDHQYDPTVRDIDDQFLLGIDLLVAPVTEPGMTQRQVYLPAGEWYDWHSDELLSGNAFVVAETPMDRIPVYARGGAVIPMWPEAPLSTDGYYPTAIELHLFVPISEGRFRSMLQEDDGLTFAALEGACYRTTFDVVRAGGQITVRAEANGNGYPEFAREEFHVVLHGAEPSTVQLDGADVHAEDGKFVLPNQGSGFELTFSLPA
jgi:alpha-glucosidase